MKLKFKDYRDKVLGCWWGKTAGGTLGAPFECYRGVIDLDNYTQENPAGIPNDDLDIQLVFLRAAEKYHNRVDSHILAEYWLTYVSASMSEYGAGKNNLRNGIAPPLSGAVGNPNKHSCGAYIRSEIWACLCAGYPELAARYAFEDAIADHAGEGVYGEIFCAALEAQAFFESDIEILIQKSLGFIPDGCGVAKGVKCVMEAYKKGIDWKSARVKLLNAVPGSFGMISGYYNGQKPEGDVPEGEHGYDAPSNVAIGVLGLLYGEKDFGRTICIAAGCMEDADCTAGLAGAVLGIILGCKNLPKKWIKPLGNKIATWCLRIDGYLNLPKTIDELSERVLRLTPIFLGSGIADTLSKGEGYEIESGKNVFGAYDSFIADQIGSPDFKKVISRIPDCVLYRDVLFDTYIQYLNGQAVAVGEEKVFKLKFWNNILDQQWLNLKVHTPEGCEVLPSKTAAVSLDQKHGGFNLAECGFSIRLNSCSSSRLDIVLEIISNGRYTKTFIPITLTVKWQQ